MPMTEQLIYIQENELRDGNAEAEVKLQPTISRPVYLHVCYPPGTHDQILFYNTVTQLRVY
jgi:hypothetical protein